MASLSIMLINIRKITTKTDLLDTEVSTQPVTSGKGIFYF